MSAVTGSLQRAGLELDINSYDADAAVIWSVLWAGRMAPNHKVYQHYRSTGRPVICIEVGALQRGHTWKISVNHVNAQGYYGHQQDLDWDRPQQLGIKLQHKSKTHGRILVAGQHRQSLQLEGVDQEDWYLQRISEVAQGREVVIRPHPRCALDRSRFPSTVSWQQPVRVPGTYDSFDMNLDFDAVINYNSGPGIQAVIAGVDAVVDSSSLAYNVKDRHQWLVEICHTEYTVEEIEQGIWIKRIQSALQV